MKYRVVKFKGDPYFYIQKKFMFFWLTLRLNVYPRVFSRISFSTLDEAEEYVLNEISIDKEKRISVVKEF